MLVLSGFWLISFPILMLNLIFKSKVSGSCIYGDICRYSPIYGDITIMTLTAPQLFYPLVVAGKIRNAKEKGDQQ